MKAMFLKNVKYILSAPSKQYWIADDKKEVCIVGRSNVGKSTFINKICNHNSLAKVSSTPGYTKYINFFDVNNSFYLADKMPIWNCKSLDDVKKIFNEQYISF